MRFRPRAPAESTRRRIHFSSARKHHTLTRLERSATLALHTSRTAVAAMTGSTPSGVCAAIRLTDSPTPSKWLNSASSSPSRPISWFNSITMISSLALVLQLAALALTAVRPFAGCVATCRADFRSLADGGSGCSLLDEHSDHGSGHILPKWSHGSRDRLPHSRHRIERQ